LKLKYNNIFNVKLLGNPLTLYIMKSQAIEIACGFGRVLPASKPNGPWYEFRIESCNVGVSWSRNLDWNATKYIVIATSKSMIIPIIITY
jgi:hypothetical protein